MFNLQKDYNLKFKNLKTIIKEKDLFEECKKIILYLHSVTHISKINENKETTFLDEIYENLENCDYYFMKETTIAWALWHITRIEDIASNILINSKDDILQNDILKKMNVKTKETGYSMTKEEIYNFSKNINIKELKNYRNAVGKNTKKIIKSLTFEDLKRKVSKENLKKIIETGGVIEGTDSMRLLDFWGSKNIAGIIFMPILRHQVLHLNQCLKIKTKLKK